MEKRAKFTSVELLRFVAAASVMCYHFFTIYTGGNGIIHFASVFVEFFFILSGFFMMKHVCEKETPLSSPVYLGRKIRSFYPILAVAMALQFVLFVCINKLGSIGAIAEGLFHFKWEALLLQTAFFIPNPQFGVDYLMGQTWYLSAMMLSLLLTYPLAKRFTKCYISLICPLIILIVYSYVIQTMGTLNIGNEYFGFISSAIARGVAGTCVGSLAYVGCKYFSKQTFKNKAAVIVAEAAVYLSLVAIFLMPDTLSQSEGLFFILILALFVVLAFANITPISRYLNSHCTKLFSYLGSLSLYMYLIHWFVLSALNLWWPNQSGVAVTALYFVGTIALSVAFKLLNDRRKSAAPIIIVVCALVALAFSMPLWYPM